MNSKTMYCPKRVLEGLKQAHPLLEDYFYKHLWRKAQVLIRSRYPNDPATWLEDCFSEAFMVLLRKIRSGAYEDRNLDAFALQIVRLTYRNARRKQQSLMQLSDQLPDLPLPAPGPANAAELFEQYRQKKLVRWYHQLSALDRKLLDLRMQNLDYKEIAEEVCLSPGGIRNKFSRLLRQARRM